MFIPPPPLPRKIADQLPFNRAAFAIETGTNAGAELHYVDEGDRDAPAVVMVHGNPTWSFLWRKVIAALPDFRCIAPDLLGLGYSSPLPRIEDHSIEVHVCAVVSLIEALELEEFILVGQDWGGPISMGVGRALSDRVRGIVLGNTSILVPDRPLGTWFHRFARTPVLSDIVFRGLGFPQSTLWSVQGDRGSIRGKVSAAYRHPLRKVRNRIAPLALARMVPDGPDHPSVAPLREIEAWAKAFSGPMALVWGTEDPILGRALKRHRREFPKATVTITDAGHFLQEEVPDAIADAIKDVRTRATAPER